MPRKNVRRVAGEPLVGRAVRECRAAKHVQRVVVSTDDGEIARVAEEAGADVVERPRALSGAEASSESALLHVLRTLRETEDYVPDLVTFVQCTSPLLRAEDVDGAAETLVREDADVCVSVTSFHGFLWKPGGVAGLQGINHDPEERLRRQDRETQYLENGAVYVMRREGFENAEHRFFGTVVPYEMPEERSMEIDRPVDLVVAEQLLRQHEKEKRVQKLPDRIEALVLDFDGVFTDNKVHVQQDKTEMVVCHRGDGWGLARLKERGLPIWVLSTEKNPVVAARCEKLDLPCVHGTDDKEGILRDWLNENDVDPDHVVFLGNDVNDLDCLRLAGCGAIVSDAHPEVRSAANLILDTPGGEGAVRELTDLIQEKLAIIHNKASE